RTPDVAALIRATLTRGCPRSSPGRDEQCPSRTPRRRSARITLHARPIPHQREIPAFAAHLAFVTLGFRFSPAFGFRWGGLLRRSGLAPLQGFQLLGRRQIVL